MPNFQLSAEKPETVRPETSLTTLQANVHKWVCLLSFTISGFYSRHQFTIEGLCNHYYKTCAMPFGY